MSAARDDGGPAFPLCSPAAEWQPQHMDDAGKLTAAHWKAAEGIGGMSLRDYFAGQALAGFAAHDAVSWKESAAQQAYRLADAMLKARQE